MDAGGQGRTYGAAARRLPATVVILVLSVSACSAPADRVHPTSAGRLAESPPRSATPTPPGPSPERPPAAAEYAVPAPGPVRTPLLTPDVLVTGTHSLSDAVRRRVRRLPGVRAVLPLSLAAVSANGRTLTVAAGDPAGFRRFTAWESARSTAVWTRVAGGEIAVDPSLPPRLVNKGFLRLGATSDAPRVHVGAYAPLVRQVSAFVNLKRARQLGLPRENALLVSTSTAKPASVTRALKRMLGSEATTQTLAFDFGEVAQTAVLSGDSVSSRVGTFSYTPHPDGTVSPDPAWVRTYIRTETMPILGRVTGNKGMLPQLRGALEEVESSGLADRIHPSEYGGCYVPRYIARNPAKGLSLHTWGIAVDLNVPGNQRGTVGQMDRRVVAIFARWGFAWGGNWSYTDPMHFEMARVVSTGP